MKGILDSPECFQAYAEIDCAYFMITEIEKELSNYVVKHPLEIMIDEATGFAKAKYKEQVHSVIELLNVIIENKKIIEADYKFEVDMIGKLIEKL
tara:strand:+ start:2426 stop:2710 length:285 start_codon:yes stop_codon:yes gene_type:complete